MSGTLTYFQVQGQKTVAVNLNERSSEGMRGSDCYHEFIGNS